jgi:hypothetical protein
MVKAGQRLGSDPAFAARRLLLAFVAIHQSAPAVAFHAPAFAVTVAPRPHRGLSTQHGLRTLRPLHAPLTTDKGLGQTSMVLGAAVPAFVSSIPTVLTAIPVIALQTITTFSQAQPMLMDCLFAGVLYVFGKITAGAITGKRQTGQGLTKWFICGLVDGWACHAWYAFLEANCALITNRLQQAVVMNGMSAAFFTPTYCAGFLILLSLLEMKGIKGAKDRLACDFRDLAGKSTKVWGVMNLPLFLCVPLHMRVVVSMMLHYVYLVGLALWDANKQKAAGAGTLSVVPLPEFSAPAMAAPSQAGNSLDAAWFGSGLLMPSHGHAPNSALNLAHAKLPMEHPENTLRLL